jgi:HEAT repeat protein
MRLLFTVFFCSLTLLADSKTSSIRDLAKQGPNSIPQIEPFLHDADNGVRLEAVRAISELGTTQSLAPLIQATADNDPEVQIRATDGLVNFYLPGYLKPGIQGKMKKAATSIKGRFTEVNDDVIDGYVEVRPDVIASVGRLARGGASLDARANAARALGVLRGDAALPDLAEALKTKDSTVLYETLKAFEKIRNPKAAGYFLYLLRDLNERVQIMALETAGVLGNREALPGLREAFSSARTLKVQRAALSAIGKMPDPASRPLFDQFLNEKDPDLRACAAEGFARLKDPQDFERMDRAFKVESKPQARLGMAFADVMLGRLELASDAPLQYLINELKSRFYGGIAQAYLIEVARDQTSREAIYPALTGAAKEVKIQLAQVFGASGGNDSIKYLEVLQADRDSEVQQAALSGIRTLKARLRP